MTAISLEKIAQYADRYIALSEGKKEILASAKTIKEVHAKLEKMDIKNVVIHYVPPLNVAISPLCQ